MHMVRGVEKRERRISMNGYLHYRGRANSDRESRVDGNLPTLLDWKSEHLSSLFERRDENNRGNTEKKQLSLLLLFRFEIFT